MHRSPLKSAAAIACAAVLALGLVGCGGDDEKDKPDGTSTGNTDPAFVGFKSAAEEKCQQVYSRLRALGEGLSSPGPEKIKEVVTEGADAYVALVADLKKLTPPPNLVDGVDQWLAEFTAAAGKLKKDAEDGKIDGVGLLAKPDGTVTTLGIDRCATGSE